MLKKKALQVTFTQKCIHVISSETLCQQQKDLWHQISYQNSRPIVHMFLGVYELT